MRLGMTVNCVKDVKILEILVKNPITSVQSCTESNKASAVSK